MLSWRLSPDIPFSGALAIAGWPPSTETAPPLMRICPAASRLAVMMLSCLSPNTDSKLSFGEKLALILMVIVLSVVGLQRSRMNALACDRMHSHGSDDGLEGRLQTLF